MQSLQFVPQGQKIPGVGLWPRSSFSVSKHPRCFHFIRIRGQSDKAGVLWGLAYTVARDELKQLNSVQALERLEDSNGFWVLMHAIYLLTHSPNDSYHRRVIQTKLHWPPANNIASSVTDKRIKRFVCSLSSSSLPGFTATAGCVLICANLSHGSHSTWVKRRKPDSKYNTNQSLCGYSYGELPGSFASFESALLPAFCSLWAASAEDLAASCTSACWFQGRNDLWFGLVEHPLQSAQIF